MEMGFARSLRDVVPRVELLGFTPDRVEQEYSKTVETCFEERQGLNNEGLEQTLDLMDFAEFCKFAAAYPIEGLDNTFISSLGPESERRIRGRF